MKNGYAVCLENITFGYANHMVLNNVNLEADEGAHIGIIGDSGCGKSTLLSILAGLEEKTSGEIVYSKNSTGFQNLKINIHRNTPILHIVHYYIKHLGILQLFVCIRLLGLFLTTPLPKW